MNLIFPDKSFRAIDKLILSSRFRISPRILFLCKQLLSTCLCGQYQDLSKSVTSLLYPPTHCFCTRGRSFRRDAFNFSFFFWLWIKLFKEVTIFKISLGVRGTFSFVFCSTQIRSGCYSFIFTYIFIVYCIVFCPVPWIASQLGAIVFRLHFNIFIYFIVDIGWSAQKPSFLLPIFLWGCFQFWNLFRKFKWLHKKSL